MQGLLYFALICFVTYLTFISHTFMVICHVFMVIFTFMCIAAMISCAKDAIQKKKG